MLKHIIFYDFAGKGTPEEKAKAIQGIKEALEGLKAVIPEIIESTVFTELLAGSEADFVLYSSFENQAALEAYLQHPAHVRVAAEAVRPQIKNRRCVDFEVCG